MKKLVLSFLIVFTLFGGTSISKLSYKTNAKEKIVYIGEKGTKYHKYSCRTLKKTKIEITETEAIDQGYTACKVCKP